MFRPKFGGWHFFFRSFNETPKKNVENLGEVYALSPSGATALYRNTRENSSYAMKYKVKCFESNVSRILSDIKFYRTF